MQKIKKKVTVYLGRGIAAVLALMLVALPCLSFPAMAAEKVEKTITWDGNYSDPSKIVSLPHEETGTLLYYYWVSPFLVEPDDFLFWKFNYSPDVYEISSSEDMRPAGVPVAYIHYFWVPLAYFVYEQFSIEGLNFLPGIYFQFAPAESGTQSENFLSEFGYLAEPVAPSFAGSVGDGITGVLGWVGTVISSIVTPGGSLYTLLPLFVLGISIAVIFVAYKIIRAYMWGV